MSKQTTDFEKLLKTQSTMEDKGSDPFKRSDKIINSPPQPRKNPVVVTTATTQQSAVVPVTTTAEPSAIPITTPEQQQSAVSTSAVATSAETITTTASTTPVSTAQLQQPSLLDTSNFDEEDRKKRQQEFKTRCSKLAAVKRRFDTACTNTENFLQQNQSRQMVFPIFDHACKTFEELRTLRHYCEEPLTPMERLTKRNYIGEITARINQIVSAYENKFGQTIDEEEEEDDFEDSILGAMGATGNTQPHQSLPTQPTQPAQPAQHAQPTLTAQQLPSQQSQRQTLRRPNMESTRIEDPLANSGARRKIFSSSLDRGTNNDNEEDVDANLTRRLNNLRIGASPPVNGQASLPSDPRETYTQNLERRNSYLESKLSQQESRLERLEQSLNNTTTDSSSSNALTSLQTTVSDCVTGFSRTLNVANFKISDEINIVLKGDPSDYYIWLSQWNRAYEKMKNECEWDNVKIFLELIKVCSGRALDLIKGLTTSPTEKSLDIALGIFQKFYGNKFRVVQDLIKKLMSLNDMDDTCKSLENGYALANSLWQQFDSLNLTSEDQSSLFFISILEPHLSKSASSEWQKLLYARNNPDSAIGADVDAQDMLNILEKCSTYQKGLDEQRKFSQSLSGQGQSRANQNSQSNSSNSNRNNRSQPLSIGILRTKADEISIAELRKHKLCVLCDGKHDHKETLKCPLLKTMAKKDIMERLVSFKCCFKCLRPGRPHSKEHPCKLSDCDLGGCNGRHCKLLHKHFVNQPQQARSNSTQSTSSPANSAPPTPSKDNK